jgi:proteasome lid subunit RPN8/RPN11
MSGDGYTAGAFPWIAGELVIERAVLDDMEAHALECYPSESCGFATGPADDVPLLDASVREENEADKYHKLDPETYPRTSTTYFKLNELRFNRALDAGAQSGRPIKVIYHSHCDAGAYFSAEDAATFAMGGQLMWPCAFIVVSVKDGKLDETKLFVHVPGTDDFRESPLTIR